MHIGLRISRAPPSSPPVAEEPGETLGPEQNGDVDFNTTVGWSGNNGAFSVLGGKANGTDDSGILTRTMEAVPPPGTRTFRTVLVVESISFGGVRVRLGAGVPVLGTIRTTPGTYVEDLTVTNAAQVGLVSGPAGSGDSVSDSLSIRELL